MVKKKGKARQTFSRHNFVRKFEPLPPPTRNTNTHVWFPFTQTLRKNAEHQHGTVAKIKEQVTVNRGQAFLEYQHIGPTPVGFLIRN